MVIISLQGVEKSRIFTLWILSRVYSNFYLNLIILSPLIMVIFSLFTAHSTSKCPAKLAEILYSIFINAHWSGFTMLQHWNSLKTFKDYSAAKYNKSNVHFLVSGSKVFWSSSWYCWQTPLSSNIFWNTILSQPLTPCI